MDNQKIGSFIAVLRKEKQLTQKQLADRLNITDRAVSKWERGRGCPDISLLDDLSKILEVSVLEILKGRHLDKDEYDDNKKLVEMMTFTETSVKTKFQTIINFLSIGIVLFISMLIIFYNLISIYSMNKKYDTSNSWKIDSVFKNIDDNIRLILNNKGIYSNEEYETIKKYVDAINNLTDTSLNERTLNKDDFTFNEIMNYQENINIYSLMGYNVPFDNSIYKIIVKYNSSKIDNMILYTNYRNNALNVMLDYSGELYYSFKYGYRFDNKIVDKFRSYILYQYMSYNIILKDIIEVGEIHE